MFVDVGIEDLIPQSENYSLPTTQIVMSFPPSFRGQTMAKCEPKQNPLSGYDIVLELKKDPKTAVSCPPECLSLCRNGPMIEFISINGMTAFTTLPTSPCPPTCNKHRERFPSQ
jgi:hypothetical protein